MATRRDFETVARNVRRVRSLADRGPDAREAWALIVTALCAAFAETNPRFDAARFVAACGVDDV